MRARQLIDGASFGPEALKAIGDAFDAAWAEIAERGWSRRGALKKAGLLEWRGYRNL